MPTVTLTDRKIISLKGTAARVEYFDRAFPGFGLRVSPEGRKTWIFLYRVKGRLRRLTLGTYPDVGLAKARDDARDALQQSTEGHDPATDRQEARARTFAALGELYIERHAKRKKRSWRDDARIIRQELDGWRHRPVTSIRRADVRDRLESIVDRGAPVLANRVLALIRKMLNFAIDQEWIDANPAAKMARPSAETSRSRVLSEDELRVVLAYLDQDPPEDVAAIDQRHWTLQRAALTLRLVTAQRGGEVITMRWRDLDGDVWTIPAEHAKNKMAHRVPLTAPALDVIKALKAERDAKRRATASDEDTPVDGNTPENDFLFVGVRGTRQRRGMLDGLDVTDVRPHDFRRTAASMMASAGIARLVIAKVLNHAETGVTAVYDRHSYDAEKRVALETWARTLKAIAKGKKAGAVVPMRQRA